MHPEAAGTASPAPPQAQRVLHTLIVILILTRTLSGREKAFPFGKILPGAKVLSGSRALKDGDEGIKDSDGVFWLKVSAKESDACAKHGPEEKAGSSEMSPAALPQPASRRHGEAGGGRGRSPRTPPRAAACGLQLTPPDTGAGEKMTSRQQKCLLPPVTSPARPKQASPSHSPHRAAPMMRCQGVVPVRVLGRKRRSRLRLSGLLNGLKHSRCPPASLGSGAGGVFEAVPQDSRSLAIPLFNCTRATGRRGRGNFLLGFLATPTLQHNGREGANLPPPRPNPAARRPLDRGSI